MVNTEQWLRRLIENLDVKVFKGDLDILNHGYQVHMGKTKGSKKAECIQPYDGEDVQLDDFFPTTITVSYERFDDLHHMATELALQCISAFFNIKSTKSKEFKATADKYYFNYVDKKWVTNSILDDLIEDAVNTTIRDMGEFPWKAVKFYKKEAKEKKKGQFVIFCPECGYELKVSRKTHEKYHGGLPTCSCGAKMALDCEDEEVEKDE